MTPDIPSPDRRRAASPAVSRRHQRKKSRQGQIVSLLTLFALLVSGTAITSAEEPDPIAVVIDVDGQILRIRTSSRTVSTALRDAGVGLGAKDAVYPGLRTQLQEGLVITVRRAFSVTVLADGEVYEVQTAATTPRGVLEELGVALDSDDEIVSEGPLRNGVRLRLVRARRQVVRERFWISPATLRKPDPTVPAGEVLVTEGRPGLKERTILRVYAGERLVRTEVIGEKIVVRPRPQVVRVGVRPIRPSRGAGARLIEGPSAEDLKGYESMAMVATGYAPWHGKGVDGTTAIGLRAGQGVVAVDPKVIPLRSRLFIPGYGYAIAGDTGGAIKGARIDLGFNTVREAIQFGRRPVKVYVVKKHVKKTRPKATASRTKAQKTSSSKTKLTEP